MDLATSVSVAFLLEGYQFVVPLKGVLVRTRLTVPALVVLDALWVAVVLAAEVAAAEEATDEKADEEAEEAGAVAA